MKKIVKMLFLVSFWSCKVEAFTYINGEDISLRTIITGACLSPLDYNILNSGDGHMSGHKRFFGMHEFKVVVPGYESVYLIKDDVCKYPCLFTLLGNVLPKNFVLTQRWACVKYFLPLSFGFKVVGDKLEVTSTIWRYSFLAPLWAREIIDLEKKDVKEDIQADDDIKLQVSVNGRSAIINQRQVFQIQSSSGRWVAEKAMSFAFNAVLRMAVGTLGFMAGVAALR